MSLDKSIESGREHRQPYRKSLRFDVTCRNHGSCGWCEGNRRHNSRKRILAARQREREFSRDNQE